jgi:glycosyltransferase involved in cell wall biosynthesis
MKVTIGIKAFNEEAHIAASLASAVDAADFVGAEVILADSGSVDRTVEIARQFPVRIIQLADPAKRSCGAGAQLAFQDARGDYFYLLDGDMVLVKAFLKHAISYLETHPDVAGVGGHVCEKNTHAQEFEIRARENDRNRVPGLVDRLEGGGLYRSAAVREVGYFADRNLHGFEEFELGARLQAVGWKLARIDQHAVDHYGHTIGAYQLLWRRARSGYAAGLGEVLRGALGKKHFWLVLRKLRHLRYGAAVILWWVLLSASLLISLGAFLGLLLTALLFLSFRRGSLTFGLYSLAAWNVSGWGLIYGLLRRRVAPESRIASVELRHDEK